MRLQVEPKALRCAEVPGEPQRRVRGDSTLAPYDLIDSARRHTGIFGEPVLAKGQRHQELLLQDLAWVHGGQLRTRHQYPSMVIGDLDVVGVAARPAEANTPLDIDANAVLPFI